MKDNEKTRIISYDTSTNKIICGCKHSNFTGYPCRHEIAVIIKKSVPFECSNINPRWLLDKSVNFSCVTSFMLKKGENKESEDLENKTKNANRTSPNLLQNSQTEKKKSEIKDIDNMAQRFDVKLEDNENNEQKENNELKSMILERMATYSNN